MRSSPTDPRAAPSIAELHTALLRSDSATRVLEFFAGTAVTIARLTPSGAEPLALLPIAGLAHRHVALTAGGIALSHADLWFRPHCLPSDMRRRLAETDTPFGHVVAGLHLRRRRLASRFCAPDEPACLEHRAVLTTPDGEDIAEVFERYSWALVSS